MQNLIEFIGKFHPLVLHLPIGFFTLLAVLEILALRPRWKDLATANRVILLLTIPASIASVVCGWFLARGQTETQTLALHRWFGTAVAVAAILLWIIRQRGWMTAYRRSLIVTLILLTVASHYGGSITHGENFLSWPQTRKPSTPVSETELLAQPVYTTVIQPIFDNYCVSCHGPDKIKGGLRMDSFDALVKGGDNGSSLSPANSRESLLGARIHLPLDDDDHMPPEGKPQLTAAQLAILSWWLNDGASKDKAIGELKPTAEILQNILTAKNTPHAPQ
jgi:uncharacterized membrane protein